MLLWTLGPKWTPLCFIERMWILRFGCSLCIWDSSEPSTDGGPCWHASIPEQRRQVQVMLEGDECLVVGRGGAVRVVQLEMPSFFFFLSLLFIFFTMAWGFLVWLWVFSVAEVDLWLLPPPPESCDNTPSLHSTWDRTQGLVQARQVLHHLCHPPQSCSLSPGLTTLD